MQASRTEGVEIDSRLPGAGKKRSFLLGKGLGLAMRPAISFALRVTRYWRRVRSANAPRSVAQRAGALADIFGAAVSAVRGGVSIDITGETDLTVRSTS